MSARSASGSKGPSPPSLCFDAVLDEAAQAGIEEAVLGMAHRGRLNVLANIVGKSYREIFAEFEGNLDPESVQGSGDVKYHKGASGKFAARNGIELPVTLASNPSHLEAVDPVVEGIARARHDQRRDPGRYHALPVLIHGDAAFAGQGVVAETLELSQLRGYRNGGTVHLVINNQLGFTTPIKAARSSIYPTDVAKTVQAPIFHVNGDDPEACVRVGRLAVAFRQQFHKDVVIDMVCYRLHGHNEGDDPSYTQPLMYRQIDKHRSVRKLYVETLVKRGDITIDEAERALEDFSARLQAALDETRAAAPPRIARLPAPVTDHVPPLSEVDKGRGPRDARPARADDPRAAGGVQRASQARPPAPPARRALRRRARWSGPSPRPSLSPACCSRATTCVSPARTPAAAPSASATRCSSTTRPGPSTRLSRTWRQSRDESPGASARWAGSWSTTRCFRSSPPSASSTATRSRAPRRSLPGRHSSATSPTAPRSSSTTSSPRPGTSGGRARPSPCCCRTATKARVRSTPRPASSGSSRSAPKTT